MKNTIQEMGKPLIEFANRFGLIILITIVSMIARAIYKGTPIKRLLLKIPIAAIMGVVVAVLLTEYTDAPESVISVSCAVIGAFAGEVIDGLEDLFKWFPGFVKEILNLKLKK